MNRLLSSLSVALFAWVGTVCLFAADHPPLAKSPFNADQAKEFQEQWAKHIDRPLVHTNSIGMRLTLIPPDGKLEIRRAIRYDRNRDVSINLIR